MTETEKKALALVNAVCAEWEVSPATEDDMDGSACFAALTRAIEQHEAFKREVSDAIDSSVLTPETEAHLSRFIIAKLDPLVEAMRDACGAQGIATKHTPGELTKHFRTALAARGGRIAWEGE